MYQTFNVWHFSMKIYIVPCKLNGITRFFQESKSITIIACFNIEYVPVLHFLELPPSWASNLSYLPFRCPSWNQNKFMDVIMLFFEVQSMLHNYFANSSYVFYRVKVWWVSIQFQYSNLVLCEKLFHFFESVAQDEIILKSTFIGWTHLL